MDADQPDLGPDEIARLDKRAYKEPGRDLLATRPAHDGQGDVDNPVADERSHGLRDPDPGKLGSDEVSRLARRRGT